jgi:hypothetical protein
LPAANASTLTGRRFFPDLIAGPFHDGLLIVFWLAIVMSLVAAAASLATPKRAVPGSADPRADRRTSSIQADDGPSPSSVEIAEGVLDPAVKRRVGVDHVP